MADAIIRIHPRGHRAISDAEETAPIGMYQANHPGHPTVRALTHHRHGAPFPSLPLPVPAWRSPGRDQGDTRGAVCQTVVHYAQEYINNLPSLLGLDSDLTRADVPPGAAGRHEVAGEGASAL